MLAGFISAEEATSILTGRQEGTYLVRFSKSEITSFALAYVNDRGMVEHSRLRTLTPHGLAVGGCKFSSLLEFIKSYPKKLSQPARFHWMATMDQECTSNQCGTIFTPPVAQTHEAEEPQCLICFENPQEVIFLECGHLCCCKECSERVSGRCPVCRGPITRIVTVYKA